MLPKLIAEIPDTGWLIVACVVVGIMSITGIGFTLHFLRSLRKEFADEIKGELNNSRAAMKVDVQQPLKISEHQEFATLSVVQELERKVGEELGRERGARKKIHEEIAGIQADVSSIRTENAKQSGDLDELKADLKKANERIDTVPERTIRLLRETKGLI